MAPSSSLSVLSSRYHNISSPIPAIDLDGEEGAHSRSDRMYMSGMENKKLPHRLGQKVKNYCSEERDYYRMLFKFSPINKKRMLLSKKNVHSTTNCNKLSDEIKSDNGFSDNNYLKQGLSKNYPQPLSSLLKTIPLICKKLEIRPTSRLAKSSDEIMKSKHNEVSKEPLRQQQYSGGLNGKYDASVDTFAFEWPKSISPQSWIGKENVDSNSRRIIVQLDGEENISPFPLGSRHHSRSRVHLQPRCVTGFPEIASNGGNKFSKKRCRDTSSMIDSEPLEKLLCLREQKPELEPLRDLSAPACTRTQSFTSFDVRSITSNVVTDNSCNSSSSSSSFWDQGGSTPADLSDNYFTSTCEDLYRTSNTSKDNEKHDSESGFNLNSFSSDSRFAPPLPPLNRGINGSANSNAINMQNPCSQSQCITMPLKKQKSEQFLPDRNTYYSNQNIYPKNPHLNGEFKSYLDDMQAYTQQYPNDVHYTRNPRLSIWVKHLRDHYKLFSEGKKIPSSYNGYHSSIPKMDNCLISQIDQAVLPNKFFWCVERSKNKGQHTWNLKYEELKKYKAEHGDCLAPTKYKKNPALGRWVSTQRADYKLFQTGDSSTSMTKERVDLLEQLGFVWRLQF
eukprot:CAMPEP_0194376302 /NCGR_PEP_ID=MMETSP0174-20130528/24719_1 /TAXON_ID=216777 /ORGANISM="Proboscia alata, Strain PI-D3" /LENGTH=618 /DNA_ID=CAMNT_0039156891 /DNA_START=176 /DNA_END=2032 /DNA_ORIENTATION=-